MAKKKNNLAIVPKGFISANRQRQKLLSRLYPQDNAIGEIEVANARNKYLASTSELEAGKSDLPIKHKVFVEAFVESIIAGLSITATCERLEIPRALYSFWMLAAERGEEPYLTFAKTVVSAEAEYEGKLIQGLTRAHGSDWKKYQFLLQAHRPERWSNEAIKIRTHREFAVPESESIDEDQIQVRVFQVDLPDNGRDGREYINITPDQLKSKRNKAQGKSDDQEE